MGTYSPALKQEEFDRIDLLMEELRKIQGKEEQLKKEIRQLIYKIEKPR